MIPYRTVNGIKQIKWVVTDNQDHPMADAKSLTDARRQAYALLRKAYARGSTSLRIYKYETQVGFVGFNYQIHKMSYHTSKDGSRVDYILNKDGTLGRRY